MRSMPCGFVVCRFCLVLDLSTTKELLAPKKHKLKGVGEAYETVLQVSQLFEATARRLFEKPGISTEMFAFICNLAE